MLKLAKNDIILNEPTRWSIYRSDGRLVLKNGTTLTSKSRIDKLLASNLYRDDHIVVDESYLLERRAPNKAVQTTRKDRNPFFQIDRLVPRIQKLLTDIRNQHDDCITRVRRLALEIQDLYHYDSNACQGALHIHYNHHYSLLHPIYSAFLCEMTAATLQYSQQERHTLVCAALTANITMTEEYDLLNQQTEPPDRRQRQIIMRHADLGYKLLQSAGVRDPLWLSIVEQHHEKNDGNGYPNKLKGDGILQASRIVSLADSYLAMVTPRAYRQTLMPHLALKNIYKMALNDDESIYLGFIKQLGIHPPGSMVRLNNDEIAVVTHHASDHCLKTQAASLIGPAGQFFSAPMIRDTSKTEYSVQEAHASKKTQKLNPTALWQYN